MRRLVMLFVLVIAASCDGEMSSGMFNFAVDTTCGGDPAGTWRLLASTVGAYCRGAFMDVTAANDTVTFAKGGMATYSYAGPGRYTLPASCPANDLGVPQPSCPEFKSNKEFVCADEPGGGCTCSFDTAVLQKFVGAASTTWSVAGHQITVNTTVGGKTFTTAQSFCVDGDSFHVDNGNTLLYERK